MTRPFGGNSADRLAEIEEHFSDCAKCKEAHIPTDDARWLIDEIKRLWVENKTISDELTGYAHTLRENERLRYLIKWVNENGSFRTDEWPKWEALQASPDRWSTGARQAELATERAGERP